MTQHYYNELTRSETGFVEMLLDRPTDHFQSRTCQRFE